MKATLFDIATIVDGAVLGDESIAITRLSPIDDIEPGALIFAEGMDNMRRAEASDASAILVERSVTSELKPVIQVENPFKAFITLLHHFYPEPKPDLTIHPTAVIGENVSIGERVSIGPYVVIGGGSAIGDDCVIKAHTCIGQAVTIGKQSTIHPHVSIYDKCQLGERVNIHASTVIGSDGFGYTVDSGQHQKVPHVGHVIIEDDVEIGANSVVDRATIGATVIGQGTKVDNLVQIAHSVKLGKHNILCGFTGIAGSTTSGDHVIFAANVGVSDHVQIDDGVVLGARAGVPPKKHLKAGNVYLGTPARPRDKAIEQELATTRLPLMRKNVKALTDKVAALSKTVNALSGLTEKEPTDS